MNGVQFFPLTDLKEQVYTRIVYIYIYRNHVTF